MDTVYSNDRTAVKISGDYSPHIVIAMTDLVDDLGGVEAAFHRIKKLQGACLMPRMGSESRPLTRRDMRYAIENESKGVRYWKWYDLQGYPVRRDTGYDFVNGYGYKIGDVITLVNDKDEPVFRVEVEDERN